MRNENRETGMRHPGRPTANLAPSAGPLRPVKWLGLRLVDAASPLIVRAFHHLYYMSARTTWWDTWWLGHRALKTPFDLWVYQEILHEVRPDLIVETGTARGGSALYLATVCDLLDGGRVVTIDVADHPGRPAHPRIRYVRGSSVDEATLQTIAEERDRADRCMVILDSAHDAEHVAREMELYSPFVSPGSYLIVEDTNVNGHPVKPRYGPGPWEAVASFLAGHPEFTWDPRREKFMLTFNPHGYLLRTA